MDEELLAAARLAQERLIEADHAAEVAKAGFHRAVRRLHLSGASLRELAAALHLSHQRVHQIVETVGGARRWGRRGHLPPDLACSFCGRPQRKTQRLVTGPGVYICEKCAELAEAVIGSGQAAETALGPLWLQLATTGFFAWGVFIGMATATRRIDHLNLVEITKGMSGRSAPSWRSSTGWSS